MTIAPVPHAAMSPLTLHRPETTARAVPPWQIPTPPGATGIDATRGIHGNKAPYDARTAAEMDRAARAAITPASSEQAAKLTQSQIDSIVREVRASDEVRKNLEPFFEQMVDKVVKGVMSERDVDASGGLTRDEIGIKEPRFQRLDANGDKSIDAAELKDMFSERLSQALERDPALDFDSFAERWFAAFDLDRDAALTAAEAPLPDLIRAAADLDADQSLSLGETKQAMRDRMPSIDSRSHLESLARRLGDKLEEKGFIKVPPLNVRELVDAFDLTAPSAKSLMHMLSMRYPHGLGISLRG